MKSCRLLKTLHSLLCSFSAETEVRPELFICHSRNNFLVEAGHTFMTHPATQHHTLDDRHY